MIEVLGLLLGDGREDAHRHLDIAVRIEQHDLLARLRQGETHRERRMAAHRRIAQRQVPVRLVADVDPVPATTPRHDDRVPAVALKTLSISAVSIIARYLA